MKTINYLIYLLVRCLEKNFLFYKKYQDKKRLKKWDNAPNPYGINSATNHYLYNFLLGFRNRNSLTDFELRSILILFSQEIFSPLSQEEFKIFLDNFNPAFMTENLEHLRSEAIELCKTNENHFGNTLKSFALFDIISQTNFRQKKNGDNPVRNIKKFFCEFRIILKNHILEPNKT